MKQWLSQRSMRTKLSIFTAVSMVGLLSIAAMLVYAQYEQALEARRAHVRHAVETASGVLTWAQQQEASGLMDRQQAQALAHKTIATMRFGDGEYFWISDHQGNMLMHPIKPELQNKGPQVVRDPNGILVTLEASRMVKQSGQGFFNYLWPKPGKQQPVDKVTYVQGFTPWDWVLASGLYLDDVHDAFRANALRAGAWVAVIILVIGSLAWLIGRSIVEGVQRVVRGMETIAHGDLSQTLHNGAQDEIGTLMRSLTAMQSQFGAVVNRVRQGSEGVASASAQIAQGNHDLSARTESQASALEQTAASLLIRPNEV